MPTPIKIGAMPLWTRLGLWRGAKKRNKRLLARLEGWSAEPKTPREINQSLGTGPAELAFLHLLTWCSGPRQPFEWTAGSTGADQVRLARLGLIDLNFLDREISLTDAGRFLLLLSSPDSTLLPPAILKSAPDDGGRTT